MIGYLFDANGVIHGFVQTSIGVFSIIDAPGASLTANRGTEVTAMNGPGEAAGFYVDATGFLHS